MKINLSKKSKIILVVVLVLIIAGGVGGYLYLKSRKSHGQNQQGEESKKETEVTRYPCLLDGRWVNDEGKTKRHPLAVAIENHPDARPQSGLDKADIVYEAEAEGGITRFLAFFVCQDVSEIGPVRSARSYFLDWLSPYNALYVHCGGSPESLRLINTYGILDLNQFFNDRYFWRVNWRWAPHNLYTKTDNLWQAVKDKGFKDSEYKSYEFKEDPDESLKGNKSKIQINYPSYQHVVKYAYNRGNNSYLRSQGGVPFKDRLTGKQISVKNVVVIWLEAKVIDYHGRLNMKTSGQGEALVFLDGKVIKARWKKSSRLGTLKFYDKSGNEIKFNRGSIWIQVVSTGTKVTY